METRANSPVGCTAQSPRNSRSARLEQRRGGQEARRERVVAGFADTSTVKEKRERYVEGLPQGLLQRGMEAGSVQSSLLEKSERTERRQEGEERALILSRKAVEQ